MNIVITPGKYLIAVSGGVDSMVLLDSIRRQVDVQLVVAHFDHGIRPDSTADCRFVQTIAERYDLPFVSARAELGPTTSEATARRARYNFLRTACLDYQAQAILTAHHQDDILETVILNILRGTGRHGLTSLQSTATILRPLLAVLKSEIVQYAQDNHLEWREDSTNTSIVYRRNYIRHQILPHFDFDDRRELLGIVNNMRRTNQELDSIIEQLVRQITQDSKLNRRKFILLPHALAREVMASWLQSRGIGEINRNMLERLVQFAKTSRPCCKINVNNNHWLSVEIADLALDSIER